MAEGNIIITSSKNSDIMLYYYSGHKGVSTVTRDSVSFWQASYRYGDV